MNIRLARTDDDITVCCPVMRELRPHVSEEKFVARVRLQEQSGYQLALVEDDSEIVAVAGFRTGENLAWGRFLYVDDLIATENRRSRGYGAALLSWLRDYASTAGCRQMHLDSGLQRADAHRFYEREGMSKSGFHFVQHLEPR
jgi:GNAT superfamily N-acetyltransferase